ncbi:hypothetical protein AB1E18_008519 [Capra hircus]
MNQEEGSTPKEESPRQSRKAEVISRTAGSCLTTEPGAELGTSFAENGFYHKAMVLFTRVFRFNPQDHYPWGLFRLGKALMGLQHFEEAAVCSGDSERRVPA